MKLIKKIINYANSHIFVKIIVPVIGFFAIVVFAIVFAIINLYSDSVMEEIESQGKSLAKTLILNVSHSYFNQKYSEIQKQFVYSKKADDKIKYIMMINSDGKCIAHTDVLKIDTFLNKTYFDKEALIFKDVVIRKVPKQKHLMEIVSPLLSLGSDKRNIAVLRIGMSKKHMMETFSRIQNYIILIALIGSLLSIGILFFITRFIISSLKESVSIAKYVATGDLTKSVEVKTADETGQLANVISMMQKNLLYIVSDIKTVYTNIRDTSQSLSSELATSTTALEEIKINSHNILDRTVNLDDEINNTNNSVNEIKEIAKNTVRNISSQATAIEQSSASIEEMSASIMSIAKGSEDKLHMVEELKSSASEGEEEMNRTMELIKKVNDSTAVIMDMINVINNISSQTNLLAMNAAIEAAHAGEAGRGFSVVADEIRKLAEDTSNNAKLITKSIKEIIGYINQSEDSTKTTQGVLTKVVSDVNDVSLIMSEIKNAMQELSLGSSQIMSSLESIVTTTEDVKSSSRDLESKAETISSSTQNIKDISTETRNKMESVTGSIEGIYNIIEFIANSGAKNNENIMTLGTVVSQFKLEEKKLVDEETSITPKEENNVT